VIFLGEAIISEGGFGLVCACACALVCFCALQAAVDAFA
jgi:hypothetical protein